jgi:pyruvate dehydrogenase E2 component (dihydrolipoamide acetyltransferase)
MECEFFDPTGVGRVVEKPAVYQGEIAKRSMLFLSLTFDHRVTN